MRTFLLLTSLFLLSEFGLAQKKGAPEWLDPYKRESRYPANRYLVGLSSEIVGKKQSLAEIYKQLNQMSRNQIIESIHVNVKSETEMNISIVNTESTQLLDQNSVSISKAELVGLKFENYYYKKKKTAFSFSYVLIQDLIDYNLDIIKTNTEAIDNNVRIAESRINSGDKEGAIDLLFESQTMLKEIKQSAVIIMALGQDDLLDFNKIGQMKLDIAKGTNDFFNIGTLNVHELASFYAYGLQLLIGDEPFTVCTGAVGYEDSKRESPFSIEFKNRVLNKLSDLETVKLGESDCDYTFEGTFTEANGKIVLVTSFVDNRGKVGATVNNKFPYAAVQFGDLDFLPENFEYIDDLSNINLTMDTSEYVIRKVDLYKYPINVAVRLDSVPLVDIPIHFQISRDEEKEFETSINTDRKGVATLILNVDQIKKSGELVIKSSVDVPALLSVKPDSKFCRNVLLENRPIEISSKLDILAPTVYVQSSELSMGTPVEIKVLEPSVKNTLTNLDYKFIDSPDSADYVIEIEAATRKGQSSQIAHFSYLDATISMRQVATNKEVYKYSLTSVKGGGSNFELASAKAYEAAKKSIAEDLLYELEYKRK